MRYIYFFLIAVLLGACTASPTAEPTATAVPPYRIKPDENPYEPKIEDIGRQEDSVTITSVDLAEIYDYSPPRAALGLVGYMPSVCDELRVEISPPDENYNVFVRVYSLVIADVQCDNVFQQFEVRILLGTYSPGRYTIWVNDAPVGNFVSY